MDFRAPTRSLPNRSILGVADTYFEAGSLLYHKEPGRGFYLPATNLLCHSIELYLKSLINSASFESTDHGVFRETTDRRGSHKLSKMLNELAEEHISELTKVHFGLEHDLDSLEDLFQASRYPFETGNVVQVSEGKEQLAFDVAGFLNDAVPKLKTIPVPKNLD